MQPEFLADVVRELIQESGLSRSLIAQRAGIPSRTIGSWANGLVKRPRRWQDLVRFATGAQLTRAQTNRLLASAEYDDLATLRQNASEDDRALFAPWESADVPFQLPRRDVGTFIGRQAERARITQVLTAGGQVCVVQGMGGVGKSTLAATVSRSVAHHFPDGILWTDMRHADADTVVENWGQTLGVELSAFTGAGSRAARMWSVFARRRILIVFDDVVSAAQIKPLLPSRHTQCAVLVTTRRQTVANSLTANAENIVNLSPLDEKDSLALLAEAAGQAAIDADPEAATNVCELLGHLPLAIMIFGRNCRARRKTLAQMVPRLIDLHSRLQHLRLGQDEAVYSAFEQTWELLDADCRMAFCALAVFSGRSFDGDAFTAVADVDLFSAEDRLDELYALALLNVISEEPRRYQQHPLLAAFAHEKCVDPESAERRYIQHYRVFVRESADMYPLLLAEWDNIRAGMEIAHRLQDSATLLDYVYMLRPIWFARGLYSDARQAYKWATLAVNDDATAAAIELAYGQAILEQSDYGEARQQLESSLRRFETLNDANGSADAHYHLARVATEQDQLTDAETHLKAAWRDYQQVEHLPGLANVLYRQGRIAYLRGDYRETDALITDSLKLQRQLKDMRGELRALNLLSLSAMEQKELDRAQVYCEAAVAISDWLDDIDEQSSCYYSLGNLLRLQSHFDAARMAGEKSLRASQLTGSRATEANVLVMLALIEKDAHLQQKSGDLARALQFAQQSVAIYEEIEFEWGRAAGLITLGLVQFELGDYEAARQTWDGGLHLAESLSSQVLIARYAELLTWLPKP